MFINYFMKGFKVDFISVIFNYVMCTFPFLVQIILFMRVKRLSSTFLFCVSVYLFFNVSGNMFTF